MKLRQDWTLPTGELKNDLFIKDKLHLSEIGNEKLAKEIIASIKSIKYIPSEVKKIQQDSICAAHSIFCLIIQVFAINFNNGTYNRTKTFMLLPSQKCLYSIGSLSPHY